MKKALMCVALFFGICFMIGIYSKSLNEKITFKYSDNMVKEIEGKVNNNKALYLNGKVLVAYIIGSKEEHLTFGKDNVTLQEFANNISAEHVYKLEKTNGSLKIVNVSAILESSLDTLLSAKTDIKTKDLAMNLITLLVGISIYIMYTKSNKKRRIYITKN